MLQILLWKHYNASSFNQQNEINLDIRQTQVWHVSMPNSRSLACKRTSCLADIKQLDLQVVFDKSLTYYISDPK